MPETSIWPVASGHRALRRLNWVHFDVVRGCQLRCVGCPNSVLQPKVERISEQDFATCLANIDVHVIGLLRLFNYGEPLLHRKLANLLELLPRQRWQAEQIEISTNAQFVDWPSFEAAIATGILTRLVVSCDGDGTAASYETLRPPSRWSKLMGFLERAREIRDRVHPRMELITRTICDDEAGRARWRSVLEPHGWKPEFRGWLPLPGSVRELEKPSAAGQGLCPFQREDGQLYVNSDGSVVPCCAHPRAAVLGNLKQNRLSEIMSSKTNQDFRTALAERNASQPICATCAF